VLSRRRFVQTVGAALAVPFGRDISAQGSPETLYNGIVLATPWPPQRRYPDEHPIPPPYLADPPDVIPIDVGRQLFVDDFLIEETTMWRTHHRADYHPASPVLRPETPWELADDAADRTGHKRNPTAMPFSDGVFYDPADRQFKMWYMGGYRMYTCLALSDDGLAWRRPSLGLVRKLGPQSNVLTVVNRDSGTVWLDLESPDPAARYKMALYQDTSLSLHVSRDGVHWREIGTTGPSGDRTTFFYNPFRKVWVFGVRDNLGIFKGRFRRYWEHPRFEQAIGWNSSEPVAWVRADSRDFVRSGLALAPELYNLDCVGYESVMLGLFNVWRGESPTREKVNEITVGFSRDGFHWTRPERHAFMGVSDRPGTWNFTNIQSAGGCCLIVGDQLYFYVSGRAGVAGTDDPGICSTGLAVLRRDGFASMDWLPDEATVMRRGARDAGGVLVTRPLRFSGAHLFVNADVEGEGLRVEALDRDGRPIAAFGKDACVPIRGNGTKLPVAWKTAANLASLAGDVVRFRFTVSKGRLYAFWVSRWPSGESSGYLAAGGPGFKGTADLR
jgi:hypothetical protein